MRNEIIKIKKPPSIVASATVVGKKEFQGPIGDMFDLHCDDDRFGMQTWEQAEAEMQRMAFGLLLNKSGEKEEEIDAIFAGDLLNQCTSSSLGLLDYAVPFFGLYGACSTMAESMALAAMLVGSGVYQRAVALCSSHFCSAERQFRFPIEYGGQRTPTSQWTVTGAGAMLFSDNGHGPYITEVMPGISVGKGITDANNMGAAMAPAAIDTLERYFKVSGKKPDDFDAILTGDLGREGHAIVLDVMRIHGYDLSRVYNDCGLLIYNNTEQDVHAGGSGCGCSGSVMAGYVMKRLTSGEWKDVLFLGTGALMSPGSVQQGLPIAGIAHLVHISSESGQGGKDGTII